MQMNRRSLLRGLAAATLLWSPLVARGRAAAVPQRALEWHVMYEQKLVLPAFVDRLFGPEQPISKCSL